VGIVDENYETGDFTKYNWQLGGDKNWIIDDSTFYEGGNSARSGLTSNDDNMNSSMLLTIKVQTNDSISFYKKVSCEDGSSVNQFWDYLEFKIDNQSKGKWQGEIDWSSETFAISSGSHLLNWTYSKDPVASSGSDCAWIDYIVFPPLIDDTKINNTSNSVALNLYPNPADDKIKISIKTTVAANFKLQIFSSTGLLIRTLSDSYFAAGDNNLSLDTKDLAAGLYYISLQSESFKIVRKFIKF
ncbi:MAG: T9SS type A sorting domain-containing protein, partial [Bacteroidetes bacterium]|nr:T9SS type A sorting domain-containing protein [Bacteroidota bacterium]